LSTERDRILSFVSKLEGKQIICAVATSDLDSSAYSFNYNYSFSKKLSTGNTTIDVNSFSDAVYTLSAAVTITVNSDITLLYRNASLPTKIPSAQISFSRYMDAVYDSIRIGGSEFTIRYRDFFLNELSKGFIFMLIYYFCQVALLVIAVAILMKYVFEVMNKNKEVMTLFAMIERDQIKKLKEECHNFLSQNLGDLVEESKYESQGSKKDKLEKESNLYLTIRHSRIR
jgi:hypothetical protein